MAPDIPQEPTLQPTLHVVFTSTGIPGWIGTAPRDCSEELPLDTLPAGAGDVIQFLARHRRLEDGTWVERDKPPPPAEEELAAMQDEADRAMAAAEALAVQRREEEVARRTLPYTLQRAVGEITIAELKAHRDRIRAEVAAEG